MDYSHANLCCVLKFNNKCNACKGHILEVLRCLEGVYDVTIDAERQTVQIMGQVNPNYCIKALARCGIHAELVRANLSHPRMQMSSYHGQDYAYGSYINSYGGGPYGYDRSLPEGMWHGMHSRYPMTNAIPQHSCNNYYYDEARHVPYYPPPPRYNPYVDDESMSFCRMM